MPASNIFLRDNRSEFPDVTSVMAYANRFVLHKSAPEGCHRALRIARKSLIFSIYDYELIMPAAFYCYQSLDYGVKKYTKDDKLVLSKQVFALADEGMLHKKNFIHTLRLSDKFQSMNEREFVRHVTGYLVKFRNSHAHSANMLYPSYGIAFSMAVDVLNQLFP